MLCLNVIMLIFAFPVATQNCGAQNIMFKGFRILLKL